MSREHEGATLTPPKGLHTYASLAAHSPAKAPPH
jgi:hypothetical protein